MANKKLKEIKSAIKQTGSDVGYDEILPYLAEEYDIVIERKQGFHFTSIPEEVANAVVVRFSGDVISAPDFKEHIYLSIGNGITVPVFLDEYAKYKNLPVNHPDYFKYKEKRNIIEMRANTFGYVDLAYYKEKFTSIYKMRDYADYILFHYKGSREVKYEEFISGKFIEEDAKNVEKVRESMRYPEPEIVRAMIPTADVGKGEGKK